MKKRTKRAIAVGIAVGTVYVAGKKNNQREQWGELARDLRQRAERPRKDVLDRAVYNSVTRNFTGERRARGERLFASWQGTDIGVRPTIQPIYGNAMEWEWWDT